MKKLLKKLFLALMLASLFVPLAAQAQTANTTVTPSSSASTATVNPPTSTTSSPTNGQDDIGCSLAGGQNIAICLSDLVYYPMVGLGSWFAYIAAFIFDLAVQIALSSTSYALDFIATTWQVVRDVANMSFLFILVYIGYMIILKVETTGTIRMLVGVVIVALLVNFSFFFTRAVIDAGNILAVQFYNAIQAPSISSTTGGSAILGASQATGVGNFAGTKDLTAAIMNGLQVQSIGSTQSFQNYVSSSNSSWMYTLITLSMIYISMGIVFFILAGSFLYAAAKFIIRVAGLWLVIIASPIAFVAAIFQGAKKGFLKDGFGLWLKFLLQFTFYPAIYLFMFWILTIFATQMGNGQILGSAFGTGAATANSGNLATIVGAIANVGIRMGFFIALMYIALSVADKVAGYSNGAAGWFQSTVLSGAAGGVITTPARWLAQNRLAQRIPGVSSAATAVATRADVRNIPGIGGTLRGITRSTGKLNEKFGTLSTDYGMSKEGIQFRQRAAAQARRNQTQSQAQTQQNQQSQQQGTQPNQQAQQNQNSQVPVTVPAVRPIPAPTVAPAARPPAAAAGDTTHGYDSEAGIKLERLSKALREQLKERKFGDGGRSITNITGDMSMPQQAPIDSRELKETLQSLNTTLKDVVRNGTASPQIAPVHIEAAREAVGAALQDEVARQNTQPPPPPPAAPAAARPIPVANDNEPSPGPANDNAQQIPKVA